MAGLISGISFVRLSAPDLGRMQAFLEDFGLTTVHRDARRLYMRGIGESPFLHVTELGEPGVISFAYDLQDPPSLHDLAGQPGVTPVETLDEPGGGLRVRLQDPNGFWLEFITGRQAVAPLPRTPMLRGVDGVSRTHAPARVERISHTAYASPNVKAMIAWYQKTLGLLPTDELYLGGDLENVLGRFMRADQGEKPVDHHTLFLFQGQRAGMHHVSYQVERVDDVFLGGDYMSQKAHDHVRGVGRHALGSQIFDYWMSPFNQMHEHWSSSEKMNAASKFNHIPIGEGMTHDSGEKPPERFVKQASTIIAWNA